jgi:hypothetical protein
MRVLDCARADPRESFPKPGRARGQLRAQRVGGRDRTNAPNRMIVPGCDKNSVSLRTRIIIARHLEGGSACRRLDERDRRGGMLPVQRITDIV